MTVEYVYTGTDPFAMFFLGCLFIILILIIAGIISSSKSSRTRRYRRELADLYVAAKIKQIAAKENVNIPEEYESFKKWVKRGRMEEQSLDNTVEEELQEKITEGKKEMKELK